MLTILHTESSLGWGGQEIRILQEALGMKERAHRVILAAPRKSAIFARAKAVGLEVVSIDLQSKMPWVFKKVDSLMRTQLVDIVNTHSSADSWVAIPAAKIVARKPIIIRTRHLSTPIGKNFWTKLIYDLLPDAIITTGQEIRRQMISENGFDGTKIFSIPTGVDLKKFDPQIVKPCLLEPGFRVGMIGVLRSWKGHQHFLNAVPFILKYIPEAHFYIVGDGPQSPNISKRINELGLRNRISLMGHREDIPEILAALDVLVHPSYAHEGVPQTILQALAMGTPVVASPVGAIPEVIYHGETGFLVPPRDSEKIADMVIEIYKNPAWRERFRAKGRKLISEQYSTELMFAKLENLYADLLSGRLKRKEKPVALFKNFLIKRSIELSTKFGLGPRKFAGGQEKFLIVSTTGIGDTLWGTPAIRVLKEAYPQSFIGVLTNDFGREVLKGNPHIDDFFIFNGGLKGFLAIPWLMVKLRRRKFTTSFLFHSSDRLIWVLVFGAGAAERIGFRGENKGLDFLFTKLIAPSSPIHGVTKRMILLDLIGLKPAQQVNHLELYLDDRDRETLDKFLQNKNINLSPPIIGFHPGAQKAFKCWPLDKFIEVGQELQRKWKGTIVITGDRKEKEMGRLIAAKIPRAFSLAGQLPLRTTAVLIEKMHLYITNDTGPMHIACALRTPTIALFGPTDPKVCGPYQDQHSIIISREKICFPCIGKKCLQPKCLEQISAEEVLRAADMILNKV